MQDQYHIREDDQLIKDCIAGDSVAQKKLYGQYMPAMYNRAVRMVVDREQAKDLTQEVFTQVFKDIHRFRGESTIGAWIKRITINKCLTFLKTKQKMKLVPIEEQFDLAMEDTPKSTFDVRLIHNAIQELPLGCRTVFNLYLLEGYQHDEIAQILDISVSTSKTQFRRAKMLMQKILKPLRYE
ncbi:MAG: RNA polymerase sigma factor [Saprospiraceae bacterium]